jgi:hypothetical protein
VTFYLIRNPMVVIIFFKNTSRKLVSNLIKLLSFVPSKVQALDGKFHVHLMLRLFFAVSPDIVEITLTHFNDKHYVLKSQKISLSYILLEIILCMLIVLIRNQKTKDSTLILITARVEEKTNCFWDHMDSHAAFLIRNRKKCT